MKTLEEAILIAAAKFIQELDLPVGGTDMTAITRDLRVLVKARIIVQEMAGSSNDPATGPHRGKVYQKFLAAGGLPEDWINAALGTHEQGEGE